MLVLGIAGLASWFLWFCCSACLRCVVIFTGCGLVICLWVGDCGVVALGVGCCLRACCFGVAVDSWFVRCFLGFSGWYFVFSGFGICHVSGLEWCCGISWVVGFRGVVSVWWFCAVRFRGMFGC